jgi:hypothetical protein
MMSLGAPPDLLADITNAQLDEVRHAQLCLHRAQQLGAQTTLGRLDTSLPPRVGALAIAVGVAVEGCVNETLAAMSIAAQTQVAGVEERELLRSITHDETRHAALAWRTLAWLWPQLTAEERGTVRHRASQSADPTAMVLLAPCFDALDA